MEYYIKTGEKKVRVLKNLPVYHTMEQEMSGKADRKLPDASI